MGIVRLYAYSVQPQKGVEAAEFVAPVGGKVSNPEVLRAVEESRDEAALEDRTRVDFTMTDGRANEARDLIMKLAFGEGPAVKAAADGLAARLSKAMDRRSENYFFVAAVEKEDGNEDQRAVTLWVFPSDEVFTPRRGGDFDVDILKNVFSRKSTLKKVALFQGRNHRADFLYGRVLDNQATARAQGVAHFWVAEFLAAHLSLNAQAGSRLLGLGLRAAHKAASSPEEKDEILAAIQIAKQFQRRPPLTLGRFAEDHIRTERLREAFLRATGRNPDTLGGRFEFVKESFDEVVPFRQFHLENNIVVTVPFDEVNGEHVQLTVDDAQRVLRAEGKVLDERLRKSST